MNIWNAAFFVLIVFAIIGGAFSSIALHELSHFNDLEVIEKESEELCFLSYPVNGVLGYYSFDAVGQDKEIERIENYTEIKAYGITIFVLFILIFSLFIVIYRYNELSRTEKERERFIKDIKKIIK